MLRITIKFKDITRTQISKIKSDRLTKYILSLKQKKQNSNSYVSLCLTFSEKVNFSTSTFCVTENNCDYQKHTVTLLLHNIGHLFTLFYTLITIRNISKYIYVSVS